MCDLLPYEENKEKLTKKPCSRRKFKDAVWQIENDSDLSSVPSMSMPQQKEKRSEVGKSTTPKMTPPSVGKNSRGSKRKIAESSGETPVKKRTTTLLDMCGEGEDGDLGVENPLPQSKDRTRGGKRGRGSLTSDTNQAARISRKTPKDNSVSKRQSSKSKPLGDQSSSIPPGGCVGGGVTTPKTSKTYISSRTRSSVKSVGVKVQLPAKTEECAHINFDKCEPSAKESLPETVKDGAVSPAAVKRTPDSPHVTPPSAESAKLLVAPEKSSTDLSSVKVESEKFLTQAPGQDPGSGDKNAKSAVKEMADDDADSASFPPDASARAENQQHPTSVDLTTTPPHPVRPPSQFQPLHHNNNNQSNQFGASQQQFSPSVLTTPTSSSLVPLHLDELPGSAAVDAVLSANDHAMFELDSDFISLLDQVPDTMIWGAPIGAKLEKGGGVFSTGVFDMPSADIGRVGGAIVGGVFGGSGKESGVESRENVVSAEVQGVGIDASIVDNPAAVGVATPPVGDPAAMGVATPPVSDPAPVGVAIPTVVDDPLMGDVAVKKAAPSSDESSVVGVAEGGGIKEVGTEEGEVESKDVITEVEDKGAMEVEGKAEDVKPEVEDKGAMEVEGKAEDVMPEVEDKGAMEVEGKADEVKDKGAMEVEGKADEVEDKGAMEVEGKAEDVIPEVEDKGTMEVEGKAEDVMPEVEDKGAMEVEGKAEDVMPEVEDKGAMEVEGKAEDVMLEVEDKGTMEVEGKVEDVIEDKGIGVKTGVPQMGSEEVTKEIEENSTSLEQRTLRSHHIVQSAQIAPTSPLNTCQSPPPVTCRKSPRQHKTPPPATQKTPPPSTRKTPPPSTRKTPPPSTRKTPPPATRKTPPPSTRKTPPPATRKTPPPATRKTPPPATRKTPPPSTRKTPPPAARKYSARAASARRKTTPPVSQDVPSTRTRASAVRKTPPPAKRVPTVRAHKTPPPSTRKSTSRLSAQRKTPPPAKRKYSARISTSHKVSSHPHPISPPPSPVATPISSPAAHHKTPKSPPTKIHTDSRPKVADLAEKTKPADLASGQVRRSLRTRSRAVCSPDLQDPSPPKRPRIDESADCKPDCKPVLDTDDGGGGGGAATPPKPANSSGVLTRSRERAVSKPPVEETTDGHDSAVTPCRESVHADATENRSVEMESPRNETKVSDEGEVKRAGGKTKGLGKAETKATPKGVSQGPRAGDEKEAKPVTRRRLSTRELVKPVGKLVKEEKGDDDGDELSELDPAAKRLKTDSKARRAGGRGTGRTVTPRSVYSTRRKGRPVIADTATPQEESKVDEQEPTVDITTVSGKASIGDKAESVGVAEIKVADVAIVESVESAANSAASTGKEGLNIAAAKGSTAGGVDTTIDGVGKKVSRNDPKKKGSKVSNAEGTVEKKGLPTVSDVGNKELKVADAARANEKQTTAKSVEQPQTAMAQTTVTSPDTVDRDAGSGETGLSGGDSGRGDSTSVEQRPSGKPEGVVGVASSTQGPECKENGIPNVLYEDMMNSNRPPPILPTRTGTHM